MRRSRPSRSSVERPGTPLPAGLDFTALAEAAQALVDLLSEGNDGDVDREALGLAQTLHLGLTAGSVVEHTGDIDRATIAVAAVALDEALQNLAALAISGQPPGPPAMTALMDIRDSLLGLRRPEP